LAGTIERLEFQTTGRVISYPVSDAQQILDAFFGLYPGFREIQARSAQLIRKRGHVLIWNGRRRHYERWFDTELKKLVDNGHKSFNSVIQGGAAEVIKTTMLTLPRKDYAYRMVSQVHDSLWIEVVNDFREGWIEEIKYHMEWPSRDKRFKIPFPVDVKLLRLEPFNEAEWTRDAVLST
jgi:DNA polymerase-1